MTSYSRNAAGNEVELVSEGGRGRRGCWSLAQCSAEVGAEPVVSCGALLAETSGLEGPPETPQVLAGDQDTVGRLVSEYFGNSPPPFLLVRHL